jgi:hypothetical protein
MRIPVTRGSRAFLGSQFGSCQIDLMPNGAAVGGP